MKGVTMLVSAISLKQNNSYIFSNNNKNYFNNNKDNAGDTVFNSLAPIINKKENSQKNLPQVFENINEWKNFCHSQIVGNKLDTVV